MESFPRMCFEGKWLQNRLRADKNESISLLAVDIQGHQRGGFCTAQGDPGVKAIKAMEVDLSINDRQVPLPLINHENSP